MFAFNEHLTCTSIYCQMTNISVKSTRKLLRQVFKHNRMEQKSDLNDSLPALSYDNKNSFNPGGQV